MNFSVDKNEHYTRFKTDLIDLNAAHAEELKDLVLRQMDEHTCRYVILNFETVKTCNAEGVRVLIKLGLHLREHGGMLIISSAHEPFTRLFDKAEIVFLPTDIEAIDFVFMDQLEKQFLSGNDAPKHS